jgi:argininosuccinate lyase
VRKGKSRIDELGLEELRGFSSLFSPDVYGSISLEACIGRRNAPGGTSKQRVRAALRRAQRQLKISGPIRPKR